MAAVSKTQKLLLLGSTRAGMRPFGLICQLAERERQVGLSRHATNTVLVCSMRVCAYLDEPW